MNYQIHIVVFFLIFLPAAVLCYNGGYDGIDLEIYDLVEEVGIKNSFYETLQVDQTASVAEIRRAYRKLSLVLHPDKNKSPDAEVKFRQLVSIYEILKDAEKRKKYDVVLRDGLPDWRQPIYYFRKVKKMGLAELAVLLLVVSTIGHYVVSWAVYLEKAFELEEIMAPIKKKREKKRAKGKLLENEIDTASTSYILEENYGYKKPNFSSLLPFLVYRWVVAFIKSLPDKIQETRKMYEEYKERKRVEKEESEKPQEVIQEKPRPKKKQPIKLRDASEFENDLPAVLTQNFVNRNGEQTDNQTEKANTEWTEDDLAALARAVAKFPGGIPGRWDRIAMEIGRTVSEVTKKVKEMKTSLSSSGVSASGNPQPAPGVVGKRAAFQISDNIITKAIESDLNPKSTVTVTPEDLYTTQDEIPEDYDLGVSYEQQQEDEEIEQYKQVRKRKVKTRPDQVETDKSEETEEVEKETGEVKQETGEVKQENGGETKNDRENDTENGKKNENPADLWSQVQQKCLETALAHVPKNRTDRWVHIARSVPGKTKEECIQRYKLLAEHIKKRKNLDNVNSTKTSKKVD